MFQVLNIKRVAKNKNRFEELTSKAEPNYLHDNNVLKKHV